jgi:hypothetical protein
MRRTIDPREDELTGRLVDLGVGSARATVREALRIGYTADAIAAVIDRYEHSALVDPATGETVLAWWPGSLVGRLRDVDARNARPECGKWGPKRAEWTALELRLKSGPVREATTDNRIIGRMNAINALTRDQVVQVLQLVADDRANPLAVRAANCLAWVLSAWKPEMDLPCPPAVVGRFLALVDVEAILGVRNKEP